MSLTGSEDHQISGPGCARNSQTTTKLPVQLVRGTLSSGVNEPEHEAQQFKECVELHVPCPIRV
jgi:hypothetical protein